MVKFETKYMIRWGIPGWIFIFWMFYEVLFLKNINPLNTKMVDITKGLTLLISLTAIGVPLGYILHQIYFGIVWVINKNKDYNLEVSQIGDKFPKHENWIEKEDLIQDKSKNQNENYYQFEYVWHSVLIKQSTETRTYLEGRYRHLLGTIHSMGSLFVSSALSLLISATIIFTHLTGFPYNFYFWVGLIFQLIIFLSAMVNYKYFEDNLRAFQIKFLKTYL